MSDLEYYFQVPTYEIYNKNSKQTKFIQLVAYPNNFVWLKFDEVIFS